MKKAQGNKAASDFVAELANNAEYQSRLDAKRQQAEELAAAVALDECEMINELRDAGIAVESVWDFVQIGGAPSTAVSILVAHLTQAHHPRVWEGIVRSLSSAQARDGALDLLVRAYRTETSPDRQFLLANAIGSMAKLAEVSDLAGIENYRDLFRQSRKPPHRDPAV